MKELKLKVKSDFDLKDATLLAYNYCQCLQRFKSQIINMLSSNHVYTHFTIFH